MPELGCGCQLEGVGPPPARAHRLSAAAPGGSRPGCRPLTSRRREHRLLAPAQGPSWPVLRRPPTMPPVFVRPEPARPLPRSALAEPPAHFLWFLLLPPLLRPRRHRPPRSAPEEEAGFQFSSCRTTGSRKLGLGDRPGGGLGLEGGPGPRHPPSPPGAPSVLTTRLPLLR